jgi:anti-sigma B factor antagonist
MGAAHHKGMARKGERVERSSGAAPPRQSGASSQMNGNLLKVRVETAGNGTSVVSLAGELDLSTIPRMELPLLGEVSHRAVIVDLSALSFIDSLGIAVLIKAFRAAEGDRRMHTVIAPGSQVERVLRIAGIHRALPLFPDRDAAFEALPNGGAPGNGDAAG